MIPSPDSHSDSFLWAAGPVEDDITQRRGVRHCDVLQTENGAVGIDPRATHIDSPGNRMHGDVLQTDDGAVGLDARAIHIDSRIGRGWGIHRFRSQPPPLEKPSHQEAHAAMLAWRCPIPLGETFRRKSESMPPTKTGPMWENLTPRQKCDYTMHADSYARLLGRPTCRSGYSVGSPHIEWNMSQSLPSSPHKSYQRAESVPDSRRWESMSPREQDDHAVRAENYAMLLGRPVENCALLLDQSARRCITLGSPRSAWNKYHHLGKSLIQDNSVNLKPALGLPSFPQKSCQRAASMGSMPSMRDWEIPQSQHECDYTIPAENYAWLRARPAVRSDNMGSPRAAWNMNHHFGKSALESNCVNRPLDSLPSVLDSTPVPRKPLPNSSAVSTRSYESSGTLPVDSADYSIKTDLEDDDNITVASESKKSSPISVPSIPHSPSVTSFAPSIVDREQQPQLMCMGAVMIPARHRNDTPDLRCFRCNHPVGHTAKFCEECGVALHRRECARSPSPKKALVPKARPRSAKAKTQRKETQQSSSWHTRTRLREGTLTRASLVLASLSRMNQITDEVCAAHDADKNSSTRSPETLQSISESSGSRKT